MFCLLLGSAVGTQGVYAAEHVRTKVPLGNAIIKTDENTAKNPQSQGLPNANEKQTRNQERFVEKHFGPDRVERPERVERVERVEHVERVERVERPGRVDRFERPGLGKGR